MSLIARRALQASIRKKYRDASWADKRKLLDGVVAATGYERKYTIQLLNSDGIPILPKNRPATVDRLLGPERERVKPSISTTCRGNLLKH